MAEKVYDFLILMQKSNQNFSTTVFIIIIMITPITSIQKLVPISKKTPTSIVLESLFCTLKSKPDKTPICTDGRQKQKGGKMKFLKSPQSFYISHCFYTYIHTYIWPISHQFNSFSL